MLPLVQGGKEEGRSLHGHFPQLGFLEEPGLSFLDSFLSFIEIGLEEPESGQRGRWIRGLSAQREAGRPGAVSGASCTQQSGRHGARSKSIPAGQR